MPLRLPDTLQDAFQKAGINLSVAQTVPSKQLVAAIKKAYGVTPIINCEKAGELSEVGQLLEGSQHNNMQGRKRNTQIHVLAPCA